MCSTPKRRKRVGKKSHFLVQRYAKRVVFLKMSYGYGGGGTYGSGDQGNAGHVIYVYNIGPYATDDSIISLFSPFGHVEKVNIIMDHQRGQSKGYCFVTMGDYYQADEAIKALNGYDFQGNGRVLQVSFKTEKK